MKISRNHVLQQDGQGAVRYDIEGLDADQYAYIVGLVANSNSLADERGEITDSPMMPTANELYRPMLASAVMYGLERNVRAVERAQWLWMRKQARAEQRERAS